MNDVPYGVQLIARERLRQINDLHYTESHDSTVYGTMPGQLQMAASCYAIFAGSSPDMRDAIRRATVKPTHWPWSPESWKPSAGNTHADRIRELVKAGALIAAEIDRLKNEVERGVSA